MITLQVDDLRSIHAYLTAKHGGLESEGNEWALKGLTTLIEHGAANSWGTAAIAYLAYIATVKPFSDKNEQVALMAAEIFLNLNGKAMTLTEGEAWKLVESVATGRLRGEDLNNALDGKITGISQ